MQIAVLTFDGYNELDSFIAAAILNRLKAKGVRAHITAPTEQVTSMNGVTVQRQKPLEFAAEADAVIIGSSVKTREIVADHYLAPVGEKEMYVQRATAVIQPFLTTARAKKTG